MGSECQTKLSCATIVARSKFWEDVMPRNMAVMGQVLWQCIIDTRPRQLHRVTGHQSSTTPAEPHKFSSRRIEEANTHDLLWCSKLLKVL